MTQDRQSGCAQPRSLSGRRAWAIKQLLFGDILNELEEHFAHIGVRYMPIKGAYLIASGLSEKIPERRMDDIDILVQSEHVQTVIDHYSAIPSVRLADNYWPFERNLFLSHQGVETCVELHWGLAYPERFELDPRDLFHRGWQAGRSLVLPCREDALLILVCHTLVHIGFELRETVFDEISLICADSSFRWDVFWNNATEVGIDRFAGLLFGWYGSRTDERLPDKGYDVYTGILVSVLGERGYRTAPWWAKRLFWELPYTRKPVELVRRKRTKTRLFQTQP